MMIKNCKNDSNACNFSSEYEENREENNECLEFSLCGNNTALFVREVSVEDITKPKTEATFNEAVSDLTDQPQCSDPQKTGTAPTKSIIRNTDSVTAESHNKQFKSLYTKKWSGHTYFEEEIRRLREEQYKNEVSQALKMRKLWKQLHKELHKDTKVEIRISSGPEWWQEPSKKQIMLATTLGDVIKADYEEEVTGRTRQWLLDLGVTMRFTSGQVKKCMKKSLLEPVDFLLETHALLVQSQTNINKKRGDLEKPFSINERLLLSAVCVLELPTLLTMLYFILPPPKPYKRDKLILETLFGNLEDETIRYSTPYMEPLPFRNQKDFEDWACDKIIRALLPTALPDAINFDELNKKSSMTSAISTKSLRQSIMSSQKTPQTPRLSAYSFAPSIALLLSYCLSKRQISESLREVVDEESVQRRTFEGRFTNAAIPKGKPKITDLIRNYESDNTAQADKTLSALSLREEADSRVRDSFKIASVVETPEQTRYINPITPDYNMISGQQPNYDWTQESYPMSPDYFQQFEYAYQDPTEEFRIESRAETIKPKSKLMTVLRNSMAETPSFGDESEHPSFEPQDSSEFDLSDLIQLWDEIGSYPEKEQLKKAIKVLAAMGDPLSQLPRISELPTIQRWLEFRRGKNRILSTKTKDDLLNRSKDMWKSVKASCTPKGPKIKISKRKERKLTWSKKEWLDVELKKEMNNYFSRVRQEKVDNAKYFFPTMLNPYDYGSKLNRNFRDVFYTYLPSREADTYVYRPWRPS